MLHALCCPIPYSAQCFRLPPHYKGVSLRRFTSASVQIATYFVWTPCERHSWNSSKWLLRTWTLDKQKQKTDTFVHKNTKKGSSHQTAIIKSLRLPTNFYGKHFTEISIEQTVDKKTGDVDTNNVPLRFQQRNGESHPYVSNTNPDITILRLKKQHIPWLELLPSQSDQWRDSERLFSQWNNHVSPPRLSLTEFRTDNKCWRFCSFYMLVWIWVPIEWRLCGEHFIVQNQLSIKLFAHKCQIPWNTRVILFLSNIYPRTLCPLRMRLFEAKPGLSSTNFGLCDFHVRTKAFSSHTARANQINSLVWYPSPQHYFLFFKAKNTFCPTLAWPNENIWFSLCREVSDKNMSPHLVFVVAVHYPSCLVGGRALGHFLRNLHLCFVLSCKKKRQLKAC